MGHEYLFIDEANRDRDPSTNITHASGTDTHSRPFHNSDKLSISELKLAKKHGFQAHPKVAFFSLLSRVRRAKEEPSRNWTKACLIVIDRKWADLSICYCT